MGKKIVLIGLIMVLFVSITYGAVKVSTSLPSLTTEASAEEIIAAPLGPKAELVSLTFKNTEIRAALRTFSEKSGLLVIPEKGVKGRISGSVEKMPPLEALEYLLDDYGYTWLQKGEVISVYPALTSTRTIRLKYVKLEDISDILSGIGATVVSSKKLNTISVSSDDPNKLTTAISVIRKLDTKPLQALLKITVVSLKNLDATNVGIDFYKGTGQNLYSLLGNSSKPVSKLINPSTDLENPDRTFTQTVAGTTDVLATTYPLGFFMDYLSGNVHVYLNALSSLTDSNILASPQITAINHQQAEIHIGDDLGYKTIEKSTSSSGTITSAEKIDTLKTGTDIIFTPHIGDDGYILLEINPIISTGVINDNVPSSNRTEARSQILVKDGQSFVIGGLKNQTEGQVDIGVPILMQLPFIGQLFRKTVVNKDNRDILIFVTAQIITPSGLTKFSEASSDIEKRQKKQKANLIH